MEISAQRRSEKGSKVKKLRKKGLIPAIIYSKRTSQGAKEPTMIQVDKAKFLKVYAEAGESSLVTLKVGNEKERQVLISEVQKDPVTLAPIHIGFFRVDLSEKITANIPIEIIGEENCEPVKSGEGIIITLIDSIEIECLPTDLPQKFNVDVSKLKEVGDVLTIKDGLIFDPKKIDMKSDPEDILLKVDFAEQLEVEEEEVTVEGVEVITEKEDESLEEGTTKDKKDSTEDTEEKTENKTD